MADGLQVKGGKYALTSGGVFTGTNVSLVDQPDWVKGISIVNGEIVLDVKASGMVVIIK